MIKIPKDMNKYRENDELGRGELLEKLDQWIRRARRDEAPDNIIWHINDESAYRDIVALMKKPQVTEEWIKEKASQLINIVDDTIYIGTKMTKVEDFIRSLVEEVRGK